MHTRVALFAGLALVCSSSTVALAQEPTAADSIWGASIMAQPFDKEPFREIRIPEWVRNTVGCGYTLSGMNTEQRTRAAKAGVAISELGFVDPFYAYYDSQLLERRSPHVPLGSVEKDIAEYKRLGVRILGVYPPCLQGEVYEKHLDWRRIDTNTREIPSIDLQKFPHGGMLCLLGPYGDFFIDVLAEILTKYPDVDAFSFDGLHYGGVCYCQHCRENFKHDTGGEIPNPDLNDPAFRRYQHWADRKMEDCIRRMQTRLKAIKPEVALVTWTTNAGRFGHFLSIPRNMPSRMNLLLDAPDQEFWLDETNRGATIVPAVANAYIWATTNHRTAFSEPYLMTHGNPYGKDSFPPHEVFRRMMLALTYGASPSLAIGQPPHLQDEIYRSLAEVQSRKPWITHHQPEPWAGIVLSDNSRNFYGRTAGAAEERYMSHVFGTFRASVEEHLPFVLLNDWNLNASDLARFKVLVLPNTACLDDAQVKAIDEYVRNGGGLVASVDCSLFNEFGDPRPNFALAEVFGVNYQGLPEATAAGQDLDINFAKSIGPDYWEKRKSVFDFKQDPKSLLNQGRMQTYVGDSLVTHKGAAVRVAPRSGDSHVIGTLLTRGATPQEFPAVITYQHGKGRVVYLAAGFDAGYYLYSYPYQRLVLANAIRWAAAAPPTIQVEAPMCVHASTMRQVQTSGERLVVHLYSDLNTTAFHALSTEDVPLHEEVVPIHNIRVKFGPEYKISRVHLEPGDEELKISKGAAGVEVVVPELEVHSMVVADLE